MLKDNIRLAHTNYRRARDTEGVAILSLALAYIGDREKNNKDVGDNTLAAWLRNKIRGLEDIKRAKEQMGRSALLEEREIQIWSNLLPREMDRHTLTKRVEELVGSERGPHLIRRVKKELEDRGGVFDMELLAEIVRG